MSQIELIQWLPAITFLMSFVVSPLVMLYGIKRPFRGDDQPWLILGLILLFSYAPIMMTFG